MVSQESVLLIVAADQREFSGIVGARSVKSSARWAAEARLQGRRCLLIANGLGRTNASAAVDQACRDYTVDLVVSTGYAGALRPRLKVGNILVATTVLQRTGSLEYPVNLPAYAPRPGVLTGSLLTIDHIAQSVDEKASLAETGADAVDMEASAVAAKAESRSLPFFCIRSISDDSETDLGIDFNRARRPDGTVSGWGVFGQAVRQPSLWPRLNRLRRSASEASRNLAEFLNECQFPLKDRSSGGK